MKTIHKKKQEDNKSTIGSVVAGVVGAAAIAGVAVAATMALKNEKTRKKLTNVLTDATNQIIDYIDEVRTEPSTKEELIRQKGLYKKQATEAKEYGN